MPQLMKSVAQITVTTAGTRQQVSATDIRSPSVLLQAAAGNTGNIYVGDSTVAATKGIELIPGASVRIEGTYVRSAQDEVSLADIYVDTATNGNKVNVSYLTRK